MAVIPLCADKPYPVGVSYLMNAPVETEFEQAIARYQNGESIDVLIPVFKDICDRAPKNSAAWTCLAWLYLLGDRPKSAYKAASKAVKLSPQDPQAQVNLALAMLDTQKKGVRQHIDNALEVMAYSDELREELQRNCQDGLTRKPDWDNLKRVQNWLFA
jgi:predicted Zn-dependent protease